MENCPHCGASLPPVGDAFCQECFRALDEPPRTAGSDSVEPGMNRNVRIGLVCGAAVGLIGGFLLMPGAFQRYGGVGAAGAVVGQISVGALLGVLIGTLYLRGQ